MTQPDSNRARQTAPMVRIRCFMQGLLTTAMAHYVAQHKRNATGAMHLNCNSGLVHCLSSWSGVSLWDAQISGTVCRGRTSTVMARFVPRAYAHLRNYMDDQHVNGDG